MTETVDLAHQLDAAPEVRLTGYTYGLAYTSDPAGLWRAPSGLTLLGGPELALTVALPWGVLVAAGVPDGGTVELYSMNQHTERLAFPVGQVPSDLPGWADAAVRALPPGQAVRLVINRELPVQMGLLTDEPAFCVLSLALRDLCGTPLPAATGDPAYAASLHMRTRHALLVDGPDLEHLPFDLGIAGLRLLVLDVASAEEAPGADGGDVHSAAARLHAGDLPGFAETLTEAHEPGVEALDVALAAVLDSGALGGRAVGRCLVAVAPMAEVPRIRAAVKARLSGVVPRAPRLLTAVTAEGARQVG